MLKEYIGDIYKITKINGRLLGFIKKYDIVNEDERAACHYELIKSSANLIEFGNYFIDIDDLDKYDINYLCELIKDNKDSDIFIKKNVFNPYVGEMFVENIRLVKGKILK